jgi:hypothetical protein
MVTEQQFRVVTEQQLRDELGQCFRILDLREFRFDVPEGKGENFLAWSCLLGK